MWPPVVVLIAVVAGCGGKAPPAPAKGGPPPPPPPKAVACIEQPEGPANVTMAGSFGSRLYYCVGPQHEQCFNFDTGTGALEKLAEPPKVTPSHIARVKAI